MKVQQALFAGLLFLLLGASLAFAAPAADAAAPAADETRAVDSAPADVFSVSLLSHRDCDAKGAAGTIALSLDTCGHCGPSDCWLQGVDSECGGDGRFCRAVIGVSCSDAWQRCICSF